MTNRNLIFSTFLIYLAFVIYGSLVPFKLRYLPLEQAWSIFRNIPYLKLSVVARADWIANIVLYIPLAFLGCVWATGFKGNKLPGFTVVGIFFFCITVAIAVEFIQIYFAPRTVSLNDLIAETLGTIGGVTLWFLGRRRITQLWKEFREGGRQSVLAALTFLSAAYVAFSLFPYDFVISASELSLTLSSGKHGWLVASNCSADWLRCSARQIGVLVSIAPLGILLGLAFPRIGYRHIFLIGIALGFALEILQLLLASGTSQGFSILLRGAGLLTGTAIAHILKRHGLVPIARFIWRATPFIALPYLLFVAAVNGWFSRPWLDLADGLARFSDVKVMPFYYHYFSTEPAAMASLLAQAVMYAPIGIVLWARYIVKSQPAVPKFLLTALIAAGLSLPIETGKLMVPPKHPDFTNVLIGVTSAVLTWALAYWVQCFLTSKKLPHDTYPSAKKPASAQIIVRSRFGPAGIIGAASLCMAIVAVVTSPLGAAKVLPLLLAYVMLLWWRPGLWLVWVLAMLPLLDLTPWSGRLYWTEYDTLLLATIGVCYLGSYLHLQPVLCRTAKLLLSAIGLSAALSLAIGLLPLGSLDHNAFANYTSSYNALRAAKGLFFALAFIPLLVLEWSEPVRAARRFAFGMTLGLAAEVVYILWERITFSGLLNFETDYRITGSFPGMHIGGAYVEGYLVTALPFVALWAWQQRRMGTTILAAGLYGLGAYSIMVTFSRGGQAAFAFATLIMVLGFTRLTLRDRARRFAGIGAVILITVVVVAVAWPIFRGKYSQSRMATIKQDLTTRTDHWADAMNLLRLKNGSVFGVGLGTFPAAYFGGPSKSTLPATFTFVTENGNTFLWLDSGGETLYFDQPVTVMPEQRYTLAMDLRASTKNAALNASVCEKALLYSFTCAWTTLQVNASPGQWEYYENQIQTKNFGQSYSLFRRPVKLSFFNGPAGSIVEVDNVALRDTTGKNLLRNGDFSEGMHHWFFSTDSHLAWHVKDLYLHVLFEQGWVGLICFLALIAYAAVRLLPRAWHNDPLSLVLCASLTGFLIVGVVDTLIDETRLGFLLYLLLIVGLVADGRFGSPRHQTPPTRHATLRQNSS